MLFIEHEEEVDVNYHPSTISVAVIFVGIHDPGADFLKRGLATNLFDGSIYELSVCEGRLWWHILRFRTFNNRWRVNIALFPLLRIVLIRFTD